MPDKADELIQKMDKMTPEERMSFMSELQDGGENYQEDDDNEKPTTQNESESSESTNSNEKSGWEEEPEPPAEGSEQPVGDDADFLSIPLESVPEELRNSLQKAQTKYQKELDRLKEKERGADEKFRKAAEIRKQYENVPVQEPEAPKEHWLKAFAREKKLSEDDAKILMEVALETVRHEVYPQIYPFLQDQVRTKEQVERDGLRKWCKDNDYPPYDDYADAVESLVRDVPGLTREEAYCRVAFKDAISRAKKSVDDNKAAKSKQEQQRLLTREKTHHFEDSRPPSGSDGKPREPDNLNRPGEIQKYMDKLAAYDKKTGSNSLEEFMETLEEKR